MTIDGLTIHIGDCRESMRRIPEQSVQTCVTSPPYFGLRDYGHDGQIGLEPTPDEFVAALVEVFREVRRVLRDDGTCWLNLGDSYANSGQTGLNDNSSGKSTLGPKRDGLGAKNKAWTRSRPPQTVPQGLKPKDLIGAPWRVAFALQADGWWLRQDLIWHKPKPMPESVTDRCTKAHEYIFLLTKSARYYFNAEAIAEAGVGRERYFGSDNYSAGSGRNDSGSYNNEPCDKRNKRSVWSVSTKPYSGAHFATFPPDLIEPCILAGSKPGDVVLDPFGGSGTTAGVALKHGRHAVLCELNPEYAALIPDRVADVHPHLNQQRLFA